ncbi:MAG: hypothetical protein P0116_11300 [Candidatus Nitrosocosmicus sp.]|nr:hypothetical protein [Candidatus Nitrosocosmicus sp.]
MNVKLLTIFAIVTSSGLLASNIASVYPTLTAFVKRDKCISSDGNSGPVSTCDTDKKSSFFQVTQSEYAENQLSNEAALKQVL